MDSQKKVSTTELFFVKNSHPQGGFPATFPGGLEGVRKSHGSHALLFWAVNTQCCKWVEYGMLPPPTSGYQSPPGLFMTCFFGASRISTNGDSSRDLLIPKPWRSPTTSKRVTSLNHPKEVTQNCQVYTLYIFI